MCQNLALTVLCVPESGPDCLIYALTVLQVQVGSPANTNAWVCAECVANKIVKVTYQTYM